MNGWIGVDLDGTLAKYDGWKGPAHIGEPIWPMVHRVQNWLRNEGKDVRIFTARVSHDDEAEIARKAIQEWCRTYISPDFTIPITNVKDYAMVELWDDRAVQVEPNTGRRVDGK